MNNIKDGFLNEVEFGEAPLPYLRDCLTPEILETLWMLPSEDEMRETLESDIFNFGDWLFRGDNRADIFTDFYHKVIMFCKNSGFTPSTTCAFLHIFSDVDMQSRAQKLSIDDSLSLLKNNVVVPYVFPVKVPDVVEDSRPVSRLTIQTQKENSSSSTLLPLTPGKDISASKPTTPEPKKRAEKEEKRGQTPKAKRKGKNAKKIEVEEEQQNPSELSDSLLKDSSDNSKATESEFKISSDHESSALSSASAFHEKAVPKALVVTFLPNQVELFCSYVMDSYYRNYRLFQRVFNGKPRLTKHNCFKQVIPSVAFPPLSSAITLKEHQEIMEKKRLEEEEKEKELEAESWRRNEAKQRAEMEKEEHAMRCVMQKEAEIQEYERRKEIEESERLLPKPVLDKAVQDIIDATIMKSGEEIDSTLSNPLQQMLRDILSDIATKINIENQESKKEIEKVTKKKKK
ncbi:uncharacterized protein MONOS_10441 [Monocercomonoides exilis]|uniref:uncharacterized protein n=1 Tax=Monocercomonoides exilis TaxID=2049356 RepID=UPI0035599EAE|nr:hypothetical protein MONOS_10441 [Monocercomonoides exilis]|eukprot:MONOS_10441.1-p1 / transcript=MONOS_10441.1 / gene=MONOS_10441 / organism=Monocercomonoides_exilis_PA203 / gene_product=unspecified product / transcript_product=unspecified product / location=Mono_scaffold00475:34069-35836(-) / protein_length=459 / sequence_SO=supercontig / SO=protein_coding / is_pseudo=false